jgi:hypothetical protein
MGRVRVGKIGDIPIEIVWGLVWRHSTIADSRVCDKFMGGKS